MNPAPQSRQSLQVLLVAGGWGAHQRGVWSLPTLPVECRGAQESLVSVAPTCWPPGWRGGLTWSAPGQGRSGGPGPQPWTVMGGYTAAQGWY